MVDTLFWTARPVWQHAPESCYFCVTTNFMWRLLQWLSLSKAKHNIGRKNAFWKYPMISIGSLLFVPGWVRLIDIADGIYCVFCNRCWCITSETVCQNWRPASMFSSHSSILSWAPLENQWTTRSVRPVSICHQFVTWLLADGNLHLLWSLACQQQYCGCLSSIELDTSIPNWGTLIKFQGHGSTREVKHLNTENCCFLFWQCARS